MEWDRDVLVAAIQILVSTMAHVTKAMIVTRAIADGLLSKDRFALMVINIACCLFGIFKVCILKFLVFDRNRSEHETKLDGQI